MKKLIWILSLVNLFFFTNCSKENAETEQKPNTPEETVITIGIPENHPDSKVAYDDATLSFCWDENDQIQIVGFKNGSYVGKSLFKFKEFKGTDKKIASFIGQLVAGADQYDIYYNTPQLTIDEAGSPTFNFQGQSQVKDNSTSHLKNYLFMGSNGKISEADLKEGSFKLFMKNAIMKFNIEFLPGNKDWGTAKELIWINNYETNEAVASYLGIEFQMNETATVFYSFDPKRMSFNPDKDNKIALRLVGDSNNNIYTAIPGKVSTARKQYEAGKRYTVSISAEKGFEWSVLKQTTEVLVTVNTGISSSYEVEFYKWEGTPYWAYKNVGFDSKFDGLSQIADNLKNAENGEIILPLTVYKIADDELRGGKFRKVSVMDGESNLSSIGARAFEDCTNLEEFIFPRSLNFGANNGQNGTIKTNAFKGCTSLQSIFIPALSVGTIGASAFENCTKLATITLEDRREDINSQGHITQIDANAFKNTAISEITFPLSLMKVSFEGLADNKKLTQIKFLSQDCATVSGVHTLSNSANITLTINYDWWYWKTADSDRPDLKTRMWMNKEWKSIQFINARTGEIFKDSMLPDVPGDNGF